MYGSNSDKARGMGKIRQNEDARGVLARHLVKTAVAEQVTFEIQEMMEAQAIAEDGLTFTSQATEPVTYTSVTPKHIAVVIDTEAKAKAERRASIEAQMAQGVIFRDLDPYTLEPIQRGNEARGVAKSVRTKRNTYR